MSKFEILCVTMHQKDFSKLEEMNVHSDIVYANQCDRTSYEELEFDGHIAKMISTETRGVGKNRNLALIYASADVCLLADDDVRYNDDVEERVLAEFEAHPDADIMIFFFESDDPTRKQPQYAETKRWRSPRHPWGAIRIAFRLDSVKKANLWCTTLFGGGCTFPSGEDSLWLKAARKAGLRFYVSKETIGKVSYATSTWFTGYDEKYFYGIGACYAAMNSRLAFAKFLYTLLRTRGDGNMTAAEKLKFMKYGKDGYKKMLSFDDYMKTQF